MINCAKCKEKISNASTKIFKSKYVCHQCGKKIDNKGKEEIEYYHAWIPIISDYGQCVKCGEFEQMHYYNVFTDDYMCRACYNG